MGKEVCLIILFNHRFDENIDRLEAIYCRRFTNRYYLVPFYDGDKDNVIPVYECSYQFQGYLAQGFDKFYDQKYEHYLIVADDMIIDPVINENNYKEYFKLEPYSGYITYWRPLSQWDGGFERVENALEVHRLHRGVNSDEELPTVQDAFEKAKEKNFDNFGFSRKLAFNGGIKRSLKYWTSSRSRVHLLGRIILGITLKLQYPFVYGYSDIFVISGDAIKEFCRICGVFAATRLHVETAIPTAMLLTERQVIVNEDLGYKARLMWDREERKVVGGKYNWKVSELADDWEDNVVCIHPIKLSQWKD